MFGGEAFGSQAFGSTDDAVSTVGKEIPGVRLGDLCLNPPVAGVTLEEECDC